MVHSYISPGLLSGRVPSRKCSVSGQGNLGVQGIAYRRKSGVDDALSSSVWAKYPSLGVLPVHMCLCHPNFRSPLPQEAYRSERRP